MKTIDPTSTVQPLRVSAGQAMHIPVRPGTGIQVLAGSLRAREPARWLSESVIGPLHRVGEGQWLQLDEGGWLELEAAAGEVHLLLVEPAEPLAWLWRRLRLLLRGAASPAGQGA